MISTTQAKKGKTMTTTATKTATTKTNTKKTVRKTAKKKAGSRKSAGRRKTAKVTASTNGRRGRKPEFTTGKITVLVKENPKRENSASYKRFGLYKTCNSVEKLYAAGGRAADLRWDIDKGFIKIA